jgi:fermentation-respiration switch protein FrsA (DUF1100 family)
VLSLLIAAYGAAAWYLWAKQRELIFLPTRDVSRTPGDVGLRFGGAVAIELGMQHPEAAGLIVESTFTSMPDIAKLSYWMFPVDRMLHQRFDALARIPSVRLPVLLIHGTADAEVPCTMSERLFAAAREPKQLTLIPGGGHEDNAGIGATQYVRDVLAFTQQALSRH